MMVGGLNEEDIPEGVCGEHGHDALVAIQDIIESQTGQAVAGKEIEREIDHLDADDVFE